MIEELHAEIVEYLTDNLPGVSVEEFSPNLRTRRSITTPACFVEMDEIKPIDEFGNVTDYSRVNFRFSAILVVKAGDEKSWTRLKEYASIVIWTLRKWIPQTTNVEQPNVLGADEEVFKPFLDGYLCWVVRWEQEAYLNYDEEDVLPALQRLTFNDLEQGDSIEFET